MPKNKTRGGSRPGSGRPKKEPTVVIGFRVKVVNAERIKAAIHSLLANSEINP